MADGAMDTGLTSEKTEMGGVEGPEAMYVKLIASDGHEFIMKRSHALTSGTIKAMLSGPGKLRRLNIFLFIITLYKLHDTKYTINILYAFLQASLLKMKQMKCVFEKYRKQ